MIEHYYQLITENFSMEIASIVLTVVSLLLTLLTFRDTGPARNKKPFKEESPKRIAALDPAFGSDGDVMMIEDVSSNHDHSMKRMTIRDLKQTLRDTPDEADAFTTQLENYRNNYHKMQLQRQQDMAASEANHQLEIAAVKNQALMNSAFSRCKRVSSFPKI